MPLVNSRIINKIYKKFSNNKPIMQVKWNHKNLNNRIQVENEEKVRKNNGTTSKITRKTTSKAIDIL